MIADGAAASGGTVQDRHGAAAPGETGPAGLGAAGPAPRLCEALAALSAAVDQLALVELNGEDDAESLAGILVLEREANRLAGQRLRALGHAERRESYRATGCVTLGSWYRWEARHTYWEAHKQTRAAQRLERLPCCVRRWTPAR